MRIIARVACRDVAAAPSLRYVAAACKNAAMSAPPPPRRFPLPPKVLKLAAVAFGIGLLLFLLLWLDQRNDTEFFRGGPDTGATGTTETLPAPLPADVATGEGTASGLHAPPANPAARPGDETPRIVGDPPAAPVAISPAPAATPPPVAAAATEPVPVSKPPPRYPDAALRRNEGGTVRVRVTVAADGSVERLDVAAGSGNRHLDRAAMEAVRRWRFQPATRGGQPVSADVVVPIVFEPRG